MREALRNGLSRGKVECTLRFSDDNAGKALQVDLERAAQLVAAAESVAGLIKQPAALNPLEVLGWPGVLVADAADPQALNQSCPEHCSPRRLNELKSRPGARRGRAGQAAQRAPGQHCLSEVVANCASWCRRCWLPGSGRRVLDRCAEMQADLDPQRLEQELVMLAQKSDVAEELDRLGHPRQRSAPRAENWPVAKRAGAWTS